MKTLKIIDAETKEKRVSIVGREWRAKTYILIVLDVIPVHRYGRIAQ